MRYIMLMHEFEALQKGGKCTCGVIDYNWLT